MDLLVLCPTYREFQVFVRRHFPYRTMGNPARQRISWLGHEMDIDRYRSIERNFLVTVINPNVKPILIDWCKARYGVFITIEEQ